MTQLRASRCQDTNTDSLRALIYAGAFPAIIMGIILLAITPVYETPDDVGMTMRAFGFGTFAEGSPYLIYSHYALGMVIRRLAGILGVSAYGWHTYLAILAASILSNYALLRLLLDRRSLTVTASLNMLILSPVCARPQFTIVAGMLAISAGLLMLSCHLKRPEARLASILILVVALAAGFYGYLIRPYSFYMICLVAAAGTLLTEPFVWSSRTKRILMIFLLFALGSWGLSTLEAMSYSSDPRWLEFTRARWARKSFYGYNRVRYSPGYQEAFAKVRWTENDLLMIKDWFFMHQPTYRAETLESLLREFPIHRQLPANLPTIYRTATMLLRNHYLFIGLLALILLILAMPPPARWRILLLSSVSMAVFAGIHLLGRFPFFRIYFPNLILLLYCSAIGYIHSFSSNAEKPAFFTSNPNSLLLLLCALALSQTGLVLHQNLRNSARVLAVRADVLLLDPRPDQLFVVWGNALPLEWAFPPLVKDNPIRKMKLFGLSATSDTPYSMKRLFEFQIQDLIQALYQRQDVFLIARDIEVDKMLPTFIREHYGISTRPVLHFAGRTFTTYRLLPAD
ncbi:MAG TPA: hypothetical protein DCM05_11895 [Elusimicrobia bacterium]|nr:hypothetical protein [Elusimicrobiota bacterium]